MAAQQSYAVQASELEAEKARQKVKEITAIGLPQINGEVGLTNYIDVPTTLIPNFFSAPGEGREVGQRLVGGEGQGQEGLPGGVGSSSVGVAPVQFWSGCQ